MLNTPVLFLSSGAALVRVCSERLLEEKHASYVNTLVAPLVAAVKDDIGELK